MDNKNVRLVSLQKWSKMVRNGMKMARQMFFKHHVVLLVLCMHFLESDAERNSTSEAFECSQPPSNRIMLKAIAWFCVMRMNNFAICSLQYPCCISAVGFIVAPRRAYCRSTMTALLLFVQS